MTPSELIQKLIDLQNAYASVYRAIVTGERLQYEIREGGNIDVKDNRLHEPLMEHVGHLPIIASFLYPHLEHSGKIDLGRVLIMLSIHDISETVLGDILTYNKKDNDTKEENLVAEKLLPADQLAFFHEFESRESLDAKFAKSVDAMAPFLHEISTPKLTLARFKAY